MESLDPPALYLSLGQLGPAVIFSSLLVFSPLSFCTYNRPGPYIFIALFRCIVQVFPAFPLAIGVSFFAGAEGSHPSFPSQKQTAHFSLFLSSIHLRSFFPVPPFSEKPIPCPFPGLFPSCVFVPLVVLGRSTVAFSALFPSPPGFLSDSIAHGGIVTQDLF